MSRGSAAESRRETDFVNLQNQLSCHAAAARSARGDKQHQKDIEDSKGYLRK